jgi:hypothetical protein
MKSVSKSEVVVKRILIAAVCIPLFLLMAASVHAQAPTDPCTPALPVSLDTTGCGALITVYAVDGNGNATAFAVTPTGLAYDSERDDWLVGIINYASAPLKAITLSTPSTSTTGIFAFDGDGPCNFSSKDCFGSRTSFQRSPYYGYAGPDNTFTSISSGGKSGTVTFTTAIPAVGACSPQFCNATWFALEGLPVTDVTEQLNPVTTSNTTTTTVTTNFSSGTGAADPTLIQEFIFPAGPSNPNGSNMLATTNFPIPSATTATTPGWPEYVVGTPWAPSLCIQKLANGGATPPCSLYVNACWNSATQSLATASDAFCPTAVLSESASQIVLEDIFDWTKQPIAPGTTVSLIAFSPPVTTPYLQWSPSSASVNPVCANILVPATPCYIADRLVEMFGDQTTTRGTSPKTKSWNITAYNVPMLLTHVLAAPNTASPASGTSACPLKASSPLNDTNPASPTFESPTFTTGQNLWFNGNCNVDFVVNQAVAPPTPNNNFVAALPAALTFGSAVYPDPASPLLNTGSASPWDLLSLTELPAGLTLWAMDGSQDGAAALTLHWSAQDAAGISEKNVQLVAATGSPLSCPVPADAGGGTVLAPQGLCYQTNLFQAEVNIDSVAPTATCSQSPVSPNGNNGWYVTDITESCNGTDALSGIGTATPTLPGLPAAGGASVPFALKTAVGSGNALSGAVTGSQQLCDLANNCFTKGPLGPFNIDEAKPTISLTAFSPVGSPAGTFYQGEIVYPIYNCTDVGSGLASCGGTAVIGCPLTATAVQSLSALPTGIAGSQSVTATSTDCAGNISNPLTVNYSVGTFSISVTPTSQTISSGHTASYTITVNFTGGLSGPVTFGCIDNIPNTPCSISSSGKGITAILNASKNILHNTWTVTFTGTYGPTGDSITSSAVASLTIK